MTAVPPAAGDLDTGTPHPARVYDWFLGGSDHFAADAELGRQLDALDGSTKYCARHNRWFMRRATRHLAGAAGIRQFLDLGSGIPTEPNLHRVAQGVAPQARVVYVDNDPIVLRHAEPLLHGTPAGASTFVQADVREPELVLERAAAVLDFDRPVALSLVALLHFVSDEDGAREIVRHLVDALAPGSHLVLSQMAGDWMPERTDRAVEMYKAGGVTLVPRSRAQVEAFFEGFDLLAPGLVWPPDWRPELATDDEVRDGTEVPLHAGVGRKL
ncbi:SAM-dependent methyltransferase [Streptomyces silvensis]|uniref:Methyltransferase n=1 Tax=Streptomyces silvensis TaxID=1765722 RepID=A0A0W7X617_9ACTN|nr:SAM-dependent methyltransferase [Streptomyces silvensis]KUF18366.1 methyltransferase [Streptomyces silvensis]